MHPLRLVRFVEKADPGRHIVKLFVSSILNTNLSNIIGTTAWGLNLKKIGGNYKPVLSTLVNLMPGLYLVVAWSSDVGIWQLYVGGHRCNLSVNFYTISVVAAKLCCKMF